MSPARIAASVGELDIDHASSALRAETPTISELAVKGHEEALTKRIVVAIAGRSLGRPQAG